MDIFTPESDRQTTPQTEIESEMRGDGEEEHPNKVKANSEATENLVRDLHMELLMTYHRICLKLTTMAPGKL